jgi:hypothetical protein
VSEEPSELRKAIAAAQGLDERAAKFLSGQTIEQLEASAEALALLVGQRNEPEPTAPAPDPITGSIAAKRQRKAALHAALTGRAPQQPRDERGRLSFDRGARQPSRPRRDPQRAHGAWLANAIRTRSNDLGAGF